MDISKLVLRKTTQLILEEKITHSSDKQTIQHLGFIIYKSLHYEQENTKTCKGVIKRCQLRLLLFIAIPNQGHP